MERTILVVEDSPTQAERVRLLLEGAGYRVEVAGDGQEGLERVRLAAPDLIISDVVMPRLDGYGFCRAVKAAERTRRIPFVLLTERRSALDIIRGLEHGADNFITKPFEDDQLLERVRRIFEHLEHRRQGRLEMEVVLRVGPREIVLSADKQQIIELLFATFEELCRLNERLEQSMREVEEYARNLEAKVRERTRQLLQTEKIAAMGTMLAGVAHELNNPLSVVLGRAALLAERLEPGPLREQAARIVQAADRCARIVRNFLALARQRPPRRETVNVNEVVTAVVELLGYQLRVDGVEVELDLAGGIPPLWVDADQLHQVVVNLATNAHHALRGTPPPRRLTLATRHEPGPPPRVTLTVADTGPGIPPEIRERLFEPFFTTKPPGQGTGLGLSLCRNFVEAHGGRIWADPAPGPGAVFRVELPVEPPEPRESAEERRVRRPPVGGRRILVVDDEPEIAALLAEVLAEEGHRVDTAGNGLLALERLRRGGYDLVLSDLRMPELDGPGLYREIERWAPDLCRRVVFLTGDTLGEETAAFLRESGAPGIAKPLDLEEVRRVVDHRLRLLEGPAPGG